MLELFSQKFGVAYPYPRYAQVFVADFIFGGMENTSATTLTDSVLLDERAAIDYDIDSLVSHELAHQWFGDLVTCRDWVKAGSTRASRRTRSTCGASIMKVATPPISSSKNGATRTWARTPGAIAARSRPS